MIETKIIDGRQLASDLQTSLTQQVASMHRKPTLTVIIVGNDPASMIYIRNKIISATRIGIISETIHFSNDDTETNLINTIKELNQDSDVDGIMVQLPLPGHMRPIQVLMAIDPTKDVDGFSPLNIGLLAAGIPGNVPCTPKGIMKLLEAAQTPLQGAKALVVGTSAIVGKPACTLLLQAQATVTNAHIYTRDLAHECRQADIIVVAAGCVDLIRGDMIKPGVTIIDVGINRMANGKLCGDVSYDECLGIAGAITPVPGGVGPMTVACLMENTVIAYEKRGHYAPLSS